jgi:acyl carrier protein
VRRGRTSGQLQGPYDVRPSERANVSNEPNQAHFVPPHSRVARCRHRKGSICLNPWISGIIDTAFQALNLEVRVAAASSRSLRDLGLTSLLTYRFVAELERRCACTFEDIDLDARNFESLDTVAQLLAKYVGARE